MKKKQLLSRFAFMAAIGFASSAQAQTVSNEGFAVNRFEPSERGSEWFALESLDFRGDARPALGIVADYSYRPLVIYNQDNSLRSSVVRNQAFVHVGGSLVLFERLRLGVNLPVAVFQDGHSSSITDATTGVTTRYFSPKDEQALGDLRVGLDIRLLGENRGPFSLAVGAQGWIPTGDKANYTSDGEFRVAPRLLLAGEVGSFVWAARGSYIYRAHEGNYAGQPIGSEFGYAASAGFRLGEKGEFVVGPEVFGSTVVQSGDSSFKEAFQNVKTSPLEGILGAHYTGGDIRVGLGAGMGINRGYGSPEFRALGNLEWQPAIADAVKAVDSDNDGIADDKDACPTVAGVASEDPKKHGCPADTDGDGITDDKDACPAVPGVASEDPAKNGCPSDKDGDGIFDDKDACIDVAGIASDDPKKNGCPGDKDNDGVLDTEDKCPEVPGPASLQGCPDPDRDKDGIQNEKDACPDAAGAADPDPKRNGCPKARKEGSKIIIIDQVKFKTGSSAIEKTKDSTDVLEAIAKVLKDNPDVKHMLIEGHTDNKGNAAANMKLSQGRAESVLKWLTAKGFDKSMFRAKGHGQDKPIADNGTDEGRRQNRRVEFTVQTDDEVSAWDAENAPAKKPAAKK